MYSKSCAIADSRVVITVSPSDSRNSIWMKSVGGGVWPFGSVRKTNVSGLSEVLRVERRASRLVSPSADLSVEEGVAIVNGTNDYF